MPELATLKIDLARIEEVNKIIIQARVVLGECRVIDKDIAHADMSTLRSLSDALNRVGISQGIGGGPGA